MLLRKVLGEQTLCVLEFRGHRKNGRFNFLKTHARFASPNSNFDVTIDSWSSNFFNPCQMLKFPLSGGARFLPGRRQAEMQVKGTSLIKDTPNPRTLPQAYAQGSGPFLMGEELR